MCQSDSFYKFVPVLYAKLLAAPILYGNFSFFIHAADSTMVSPPSIASEYDPKNDPARKPQKFGTKIQGGSMPTGQTFRTKMRLNAHYVVHQFVEG